MIKSAECQAPAESSVGVFEYNVECRSLLEPRRVRCELIYLQQFMPRRWHSICLVKSRWVLPTPCDLNYRRIRKHKLSITWELRPFPCMPILEYSTYNLSYLSFVSRIWIIITSWLIYFLFICVLFNVKQLNSQLIYIRFPGDEAIT